MKSYFLEDIVRKDEVLDALNEVLPAQKEPWVIRHSVQDAIAYFNICENGNAIQVDVSGRHFNRDDIVIEK